MHSTIVAACFGCSSIVGMARERILATFAPQQRLADAPQPFLRGQTVVARAVHFVDKLESSRGASLELADAPDKEPPRLFASKA